MYGIVKLAPWEGKVVELRERMIFLLQDVSPHRGRYAYLEAETGLSAARWQNLFLRRLYPSMDMVYAAMHLIKEAYGTWLLHGSKPDMQKEQQPDEDRWEKFLEFQRRDKSSKERMDELKADKDASRND